MPVASILAWTTLQEMDEVLSSRPAPMQAKLSAMRVTAALGDDGVTASHLRFVS
jgi:hypothetical protein